MLTQKNSCVYILDFLQLTGLKNVLFTEIEGPLLKNVQTLPATLTLVHWCPNKPQNHIFFKMHQGV